MMDEQSFAQLSKRVAAAESRRGLLGAVVAGVTAPLGIALIRGESAEAAFGYCRAGGFPCGKDHQCCEDKCLATGVCACAKKGKPCLNRVGINCCSRQCRKGRCK
jgi:hypothetical protein